MMHFFETLSFHIMNFIIQAVFPEMANIMRELEGEPPIPIHHERVFILAAIIIIGVIIYQLRKGNNPFEMARLAIAHNAYQTIGILVMLALVGLFQIILLILAPYIQSGIVIIATGFLFLILILSTNVLIEHNKARIAKIANRQLFSK